MVTSIELYLAIVACAALVLCAVLAYVWRRRARAGERRIDELNAQNSKLRSVFGELAGWGEDGKLPNDIVDVIRANLTRHEAVAPEETADWSGFMTVVADTMAKAAPPDARFVGGKATSQDRHERLVRTLRTWIADEDRAQAALVNGELNYMFRMHLRMQAYNPHDPAAPVYAIAVQLVSYLLDREGVTVALAWPMSVAVPTVEQTADDVDGLRGIEAVRSVWSNARNNLDAPLSGLVVDCVAPGWRVDGALQQRPLVLTMNSFW
ncbi:hypothetical protein [Gymnodinialimonas sp.]